MLISCYSVKVQYYTFTPLLHLFWKNCEQKNQRKITHFIILHESGICAGEDTWIKKSPSFPFFFFNGSYKTAVPGNSLTLPQL